FYTPDAERGAAFSQLKDPDGFAAKAGLTTAEQRHPRFLFKHDEEKHVGAGFGADSNTFVCGGIGR
ncbi:MAG: hypothetical protein IKD95_05710, partial [Bacteroidales bacterium]|nr:hypothetical protein [Bacteroidales bacterium]